MGIDCNVFGAPGSLQRGCLSILPQTFCLPHSLRLFMQGNVSTKWGIIGWKLICCRGNPLGFC